MAKVFLLMVGTFYEGADPVRAFHRREDADALMAAAEAYDLQWAELDALHERGEAEKWDRALKSFADGHPAKRGMWAADYYRVAELEVE